LGRLVDKKFAVRKMARTFRDLAVSPLRLTITVSSP
jgi:hypothetical protein